ncbi:DNA mismatch repair endonuclease MutL [Candidatus Woesearchaeota archaeon]|nr:DNA mismatch repair endonuclease MutL [Candidatus Woesearchaeota archaeon]
MPKISILPEELINKIAAGEVIERPASVIKELLENSLDANATRIIVEVKDYGKQLLKVADNGEGMEQEDAGKALLRHATSKIKDINDLFAIQTLGFRGEALASIAAVSKLTLTTKPKGALEGFSLMVEGGIVTNEGIVAAEKGTTIEIEDLFFNTPARKKFLKTDAVELKHIVDVVTQYALIHPQVSFRLIHELKELLNSPSVEDWRSNLASIYGVEQAKELLEVQYENNITGIKVYGFISKPYDARNDKTMQSLFVNQRWIRNEELTKVVYDAYHSLLFVNKHPVFVLNLTLDPTKIDVNVHPTKAEIKIEQKKEVAEAVFNAVRETLRKNDLLPVMDFQAEQQLTFGTVLKKEDNKEAQREEKRIGASKYAFEPSEQSALQVKESEAVSYGEEIVPEITPDFTYGSPIIIPTADTIPESDKLPQLRLLGQVHKTFFVAETPGGIVFIDQHVVQERVLYERFMEQLMNQKVAVQNLLRGEVLELTPVQKLLVEENKQKLKELGFVLEEFGENSFVLKAIPTLFGRLQPQELLFEVISELHQHQNRLEQIQEEIITRMACRASVKAGDTLTITEMQRLLYELSQSKFPYTCPHGRAVLIKVSVEELEKKFRRK